MNKRVMQAIRRVAKVQANRPSVRVRGSDGAIRWAEGCYEWWVEQLKEEVKRDEKE